MRTLQRPGDWPVTGAEIIYRAGNATAYGLADIIATPGQAGHGRYLLNVPFNDIRLFRIAETTRTSYGGSQATRVAAEASSVPNRSNAALDCRRDSRAGPRRSARVQPAEPGHADAGTATAGAPGGSAQTGDRGRKGS